MKRFVFYTFSFWVIILTAAYIEGAPTLVKDSKHNLSSNPTNLNTIKSDQLGGTSEICVFCHTPHSARADAPLWNRTNVTGPYSNRYSSDVLLELSYPLPEDPSNSALPSYTVHARTRICLSCHDGTIALGSLVNLPSEVTAGEVPMQGATADNKMPGSAAGYIGTDFRDDHPVAIKYISGAGSDPELKGTRPAELKLYTSGGFDYIECTTCHNAHDNQYGNFLVMTNDNSTLCIGCHEKTGYEPSSVHSVATQSYSPPNGTATGSLGTTVGNVKCMNCHFPHKAGVTAGNPSTANPDSGKYLLSFQEEASCFNNTDRWGQSMVAACHGTSASGARKIETLINGGKSRYHQVGDSGMKGRHEATEARQYIAGTGWAGAAKWHVECADCHNPHTAGDALHTRGTNAIASNSPLYGVGGADAGTYPVWALNSTSNNYTAIQAAGVTNNVVTTVQYEYQICLKCHSDFAWGINRPVVSATNPLDASYTGLTNQAMEFGNNAPTASSHPVIFSNGNNEGAYVAPWSATAVPQQKMYCSDCHNNDTARSPFGPGTDAAGPHGSNNRAILKKQYDPATIGTNNQELCFDCHRYETYYQGTDPSTNTGFRNGAMNLHSRHMLPAVSGGVANNQDGSSKTCTRCHVNPPHGINRNHLIALTSDAGPYNGYTRISVYTDNDTYTYGLGNCSASACHAASHP